MSVNGVDVAYPYQGDAYDVTGKGFVFVKATQGNSYTNPHQGYQLSQGINHGLVPGVYLFMQPGDSVKTQAEHFKNAAVCKPGYMIAVDWEGLNGNWASAADKEALIKMLKGMYPHNKVGLYTNLDGWLHHDKDSYCGDFLWIADPGAAAGKPRIKHAWDFHQYGVNKGTDQNTSRFETVKDLASWAGWVQGVPPVHEDINAELAAARGGIAKLEETVKALGEQLAEMAKKVGTGK